MKEWTVKVHEYSFDQDGKEKPARCFTKLIDHISRRFFVGYQAGSDLASTQIGVSGMEMADVYTPCNSFRAGWYMGTERQVGHIGYGRPAPFRAAHHRYVTAGAAVESALNWSEHRNTSRRAAAKVSTGLLEQKRKQKERASWAEISADKKQGKLPHRTTVPCPCPDSSQGSVSYADAPNRAFSVLSMGSSTPPLRSLDRLTSRSASWAPKSHRQAIPTNSTPQV